MDAMDAEVGEEDEEKLMGGGKRKKKGMKTEPPEADAMDAEPEMEDQEKLPRKGRTKKTRKEAGQWDSDESIADPDQGGQDIVVLGQDDAAAVANNTSGEAQDEKTLVQDNEKSVNEQTEVADAIVDDNVIVIKHDDAKAAEADVQGDDVVEDDEQVENIEADDDGAESDEQEWDGNENERGVIGTKDKGAPKAGKSKLKKVKAAALKPKKKRSAKTESASFRLCERNYGDLIVGWQRAINDKNFDDLSKCFDQISEVLEHFTAPFMEAYLIPLHVQTKLFLGASEHKDLLAKYKELRGKIKEVHQEKRSVVPDDYVLPKVKIQLSDLASGAKTVTELRPADSQRELDSSTTQNIPKKEKSLPKSLKQTKEPVDSHKSGSRVKGAEQTKADAPKTDAKVVSAPARPAPASAPPKPERKAFSLGTLMKRESKPQTVQASAQTKGSHLPKWLTEKPTSQAPTHKLRFLGFEFLKAMAFKFPDECGIEKESVALAFEKAIWVWAEKQKGTNIDIEDVYWDRVHAIVAAICGKSGSGTLMHLVKNGEFQSATKVVELGDDALLKSFEGHPFV